jgi:hypothetical protein
MMMLRITKDGFTIEAETADELGMAIAALKSTETAEAECTGTVTPGSLESVQLDNALDTWEREDTNDASVTLSLVPDRVTAVYEMIPVSRCLLDVFDVVAEFPEGISCKGICTLTGLKTTQVSNRLSRLAQLGLLEHKPHSWYWCATDLARRAKLVAS